ncbi:MAG: hypothetical protein HBSIN02_01970 [Bacteroidia bacterium]|nr:MAG: hypothetical protein HBSIN02_01970 [Bacteroidia bacterium]
MIPDNFLLAVFGVVSLLGLAAGVAGFALAIKYAKKPDGEIRMAIWAFVGLAGLVASGMSWAYFLLPILINKLF